MSAIFPTLFMARRPPKLRVYKYAMISKRLVFAGAQRITYPEYRLSEGGEKFNNIAPKGDLALDTDTNGPSGRAFNPLAIIPFKGKLYLAGMTYKAGDANGYLTIYNSTDKITFNRVYEVQDAGAIAGLQFATNSNWLVITLKSGRMVYTGDGVTFTTRIDLPTYNVAANYQTGLTISPSNRITIHGTYAGATAGSYTWYADGPAGAWSAAYTNPFGINGLQLATLGDRVILHSGGSDANSANRIAQFNPAVPATPVAVAYAFAPRPFPYFVLYSPTLGWFVVNSNGRFIRSPAFGGTWAEVTNNALKPWGAATSFGSAHGCWDGTKVRFVWAGGGYAFSTDGSTWISYTPEQTGLDPLGDYLMAYLG